MNEKPSNASTEYEGEVCDHIRDVGDVGGHDVEHVQYRYPGPPVQQGTIERWECVDCDTVCDLDAYGVEGALETFNKLSCGDV